MNSNEMLNGSISKSILKFFFPILIGTFFQQFYNTVDAVIVGQFAGIEALSAVGGSSAIIVNLIVSIFLGLSAGCTVLISQYYGAGDEERLQSALHTTYAFGIIGGIAFGIFGVVFSPVLLDMLDTPKELLELSDLYLTIYFSGIIFLFIYNLGSAVLRAIGDSKRPLYYLIASTVVNICLDLLFVVVFKLSVLGVALATVISQAVSAFLVTNCLMRKSQAVKLYLRKIRVDFTQLKKMLGIGLPAALQSSTYAISNMVIQWAVNLFGVTVVAAFTAEAKVDVIFWMINGSFGTATATFVGQNYGAGNLKRMKQGINRCLAMSFGTAVIIVAALLSFGKYMLLLFTTDASVIEVAARMIMLIAPGYLFFVFIEVYSASLRAQGDTLIPTLINIVFIVVYRCIWVTYFGHRLNLDMIMRCYPFSWIMCSLAITIYYFLRNKKVKA